MYPLRFRDPGILEKRMRTGLSNCVACRAEHIYSHQHHPLLGVIHGADFGALEGGRDEGCCASRSVAFSATPVADGVLIVPQLRLGDPLSILADIQVPNVRWGFLPLEPEPMRLGAIRI